MSGETRALNQVQKIPTFTIIDRIVVQPHTWYEVPAGKKALVRGYAVCTNTGAAATADLNAGGLVVGRWAATGGSDNPAEVLNLNPGVRMFFAVQLDPLDEIETTQSSGTNAEFDLYMEIQETPI